MINPKSFEELRHPNSKTDLDPSKVGNEEVYEKVTVGERGRVCARYVYNQETMKGYPGIPND